MDTCRLCTLTVGTVIHSPSLSEAGFFDLTTSWWYERRKLEFYVVLQALSQLAPELRRQIWSIGNIVCFGISNFDEAYELAQQHFRYEPRMVKLAEKTENQQPIIESDRGQYLEIANKIQRMRHRECIVRRYMSEKQLDPYVRYISETKQLSDHGNEESVSEVKERLVKERSVLVRDALEVINKRELKKIVDPSWGLALYQSRLLRARPVASRPMAKKGGEAS